MNGHAFNDARCSHCGREYDDLTRAEADTLASGGPCPSDDCAARWTDAERDAAKAAT